jgi:hypothetical protein
MVDCEFCKILIKDLREGTGHFENLNSEVRKHILDSMNLESKYRGTDEFETKGPVMEANSYCRGFPLCDKHIRTIKIDNKLRAKKGLDIPANLEIMGKLRLYGW